MADLDSSIVEGMTAEAEADVPLGGGCVQIENGGVGSREYWSTETDAEGSRAVASRR